MTAKPQKNSRNHLPRELRLEAMPKEILDETCGDKLVGTEAAGFISRGRVKSATFSLRSFLRWKAGMYTGTNICAFGWPAMLGLSQREAASRFGIARETVRKMLRHSEPPGYRRALRHRRQKLARLHGYHRPYCWRRPNGSSVSKLRRRRGFEAPSRRTDGHGQRDHRAQDYVRDGAFVGVRCLCRCPILRAMLKRTLARRMRSSPASSIGAFFRHDTSPQRCLLRSLPGRRRRRPGWTGTTEPLSCSAAFPNRFFTTDKCLVAQSCQMARLTNAGVPAGCSPIGFEDRYAVPARVPLCQTEGVVGYARRNFMTASPYWTLDPSMATWKRNAATGKATSCAADRGAYGERFVRDREALKRPLPVTVRRC